MSDEVNDPNLVVSVEGIGTFVFRKRNMDLQVKIRVEMARMTEGMAALLDEFSARFILALAELKILTVKAPADSGMEADQLGSLDVLDPDDERRVIDVWSALRDKEETFRKARKAVPAGR